MPRGNRDLEDQKLYHVFTRGINKQTIFHNNLQRNTFLKYLKEAKDKYGIEILFYCLMGNHYHLAIKNSSGKIPEFMKSVNQRYSHLYNSLNTRSGSLYGDRYKSVEINSLNYLSTLFAYIHLNPVADDFVSKPEDWKWSSFSEYQSLTSSDLISKETFLSYFGKDPWEQIKNYMSSKYSNILHETMNQFYDKNNEDKLEEYLYWKDILQNKDSDNITIEDIAIQIRDQSKLSYRFISKLTGISKSSLQRLCGVQVGQKVPVPFCPRNINKHS